MEAIATQEARRLALTRTGLLKPEWTGFPKRATGRSLRARKAAHHVIKRFKYLQLETVSIAGARSHAIVLLLRLEGFDRMLAEALLQPNEFYESEEFDLRVFLIPVLNISMMPHMTYLICLRELYS